FDAARAEALLDAAGCVRGAGGWRTTPDGAAWQPELMVVAGWSDWVRATSLMVDDLRAVGVDASMRAWDFGAWFDRLGRGGFDLSIGWSPEGATPYAMYSALLSARSVRPIGVPSPQSWHRWGSAEADALLDAFDATPEEDAQRPIVAALEAIMVRELPAIPLFPGPSWGQARTGRFVGFPSADDPYARLSPNHHPDPLLVMTRLRPAAP
ncbi:MAG TPA: ABC transporter substrate-binding protein, partial [Myxococcota bacterium]|nr:ABC transporter substrate-binding protein [Myxococcota bacterium]